MTASSRILQWHQKLQGVTALATFFPQVQGGVGDKGDSRETGKRDRAAQMGMEHVKNRHRGKEEEVVDTRYHTSSSLHLPYLLLRACMLDIIPPPLTHTLLLLIPRPPGLPTFVQRLAVYEHFSAEHDLW